MGAPGEHLSRLKATLDRGETALGAVLTMPSVQMAQAIARMGFDWVVVDMEHYPMDIRDVHETIAAMAGADTTPLVRIHWNEHWLAKPALDAGALGIVFPMIRNREEAEAAVAAVRYPPDGVRGWGPTYAQLRWNLDAREYARLANEEILTVGLIEHGQAVRNIRSIAETPGLDVAFIAPSDLAATLGHLGDVQHPDVREAISEIEQVVLNTDAILGGVAGSAEAATQMMERGYRFLNLGSDVSLLSGAASTLLDSIRGA